MTDYLVKHPSGLEEVVGDVRRDELGEAVETLATIEPQPEEAPKKEAAKK